MLEKVEQQVETVDMMEEEEYDPTVHNALVDKIHAISGAHHIRDITRTEPSAKVSEFGLSKKQEDAVRLADLRKFIKKTKKHPTVVQQLSRLAGRKPLNQPLEKIISEKIERKAGFVKVQHELSAWEPVVTATEIAPQTVFPLQYGNLDVLNEPPKKVSEYRVKTKLMEAMEELDRKYDGDTAANGENSDDENDGPDYAMTLEEMRQQQRERARQKIRESYRIAKGRRMNKIKSKTYHRLLKRDKLRQQMKEFEELREKDPEAALAQLDRIEKQRFEERATLRHKNTGTWAKNLQVRAKYNMDVRRELADQLAIGRELTARRLQEDGSSSESDVELEVVTAERENPWTQQQQQQQPKGEYEQAANQQKSLTSGYRKYWEERNRVQNAKNQLQADNEEQQEESSDNDEEDGTIEEFKKKLETSGTKKQNKKNKKQKVASTSNGWEVEDAEDGEEPSEEDDDTDDEPGTAKKRKAKLSSVEDLFDEAEQMIVGAIKGKLKRVRTKVAGVENSRKTTKPAPKQKQSRAKATDSGLAFKKKPRLADADIELNESARGVEKQDPVKPFVVSALNGTPALPTAAADINPKQVVQMKPKHLLTALPDAVATGELSGDEDPEETGANRQRLTIAEAFEDDDIVADFVKEKQDERDKNMPQEIDNTLPGWGSWAGPGVKKKKRAQKVRKIFKPPTELPRRDDNKDQVIINEDGMVNEKLKKHLLNEVPFPFVTVKDFEASLRAPIGRSFIPESAHTAMIEPSVITKKGVVIEPMKKEMLLQDPNKVLRFGTKKLNGATEKYREFADKFVNGKKLSEKGNKGGQKGGKGGQQGEKGSHRGGKGGQRGRKGGQRGGKK
ncbi:U3 small nucleolar RNA-associated protein 14 homolog A [Anopheles aquasalis]|uniref:U3 small nucleolar RNA-associated protein 14 homolog A n=1 Tax=Anopheles aquasalis TaxID=42839 RepID=UPI00215A4A92|nr:U3 small nucleolar RNA-associated protein 14 homolog A [Anopheles aquasalis]